MTRTNDFGQPVGELVEWPGARAPEPVVLSGGSVELQPLKADHAAGIAANLGTHPELWTYRSDEPPGDVKEAAQMLAHGASETDHLTFAVVPRSSGEVEGLASYFRVDPVQGSIEVGAILYAPTLQRTRAATEAQYLLMRYAFDELGHRRYEWKCDSLNQPSREAALRLGFTEEGTFRNAMVYKGRTRDTTWFSITDAEWPSVRTALETWLGDDNHDGSGQQRRSLADVRRETRG